MGNVLDCDIVVSEFELLPRYYVSFWGKSIDFLIPPPSYGLKVPLLFFYKDRYGTKWPMKVDMPLKKLKIIVVW